EDNGYAISTPVEVQTAGGSVSQIVRGYPHIYVEECDGTDVQESYETLQRAAQYCRERRGPALVHAHVIRPYSHSLSDVESDYRPQEERVADAGRDPIKRLGELLIEVELATAADLKKLRDEVDREISEAADRALAIPQPAKETATLYVYSPDVDPTAKE